MVYVTPAETYEVHPACLPLSERFANGSSSHTIQHCAAMLSAIDVSKESKGSFFLELKGVERERISLPVHIMLKNKQTCRIAEIGQTAW
jgi:hypothetical protein